MADPVWGVVKGGKELHHRKEGHQVLGFDRKEKVEINIAVWKHQGVGHQYPKDGSRGSDSGSPGGQRGYEGKNSRADTTQKVVFYKFSGPPVPFNLGAEHPQGKHIEENVEDPSV